MSVAYREKIIVGASELFLREGIKSVSMDKIASQLSVSKRTIYMCFSDKEELVRASLKYMKEQKEKTRADLRKNSSCVFSFMVSLFRTVANDLSGVSINFLEDIDSMLPELVENSSLGRKKQIEAFRELVDEAKQDGHIVETFSTEILADLFYNSMMSMKVGNYDYTKISYVELFQTLVCVYFRGVATKEGLEVFRESFKDEVVKYNEYKSNSNII